MQLLGVAIGSIGQMDGQFEYIENVTAERVTCIGSRYAAYVKTWTVGGFVHMFLGWWGLMIRWMWIDRVYSRDTRLMVNIRSRL